MTRSFEVPGQARLGEGGQPERPDGHTGVFLRASLRFEDSLSHSVAMRV